MYFLNSQDFQMIIAACLLGLGAVTFAIGVAVLVFRGAGGSTRTLANQTAKLAQKGLTDDVSGLVGNASALVESLNQMSKSAAGVGFFLVLISIVFMAASYFVVTQIH